jgi:hypothetical protein
VLAALSRALAASAPPSPSPSSPSSGITRRFMHEKKPAHPPRPARFSAARHCGMCVWARLQYIHEHMCVPRLLVTTLYANSTLLIAHAYTCTGLSCIHHAVNKNSHPSVHMCVQTC